MDFLSQVASSVGLDAYGHPRQTERPAVEREIEELAVGEDANALERLELDVTGLLKGSSLFGGVVLVGGVLGILLIGVFQSLGWWGMPI